MLNTQTKEVVRFLTGIGQEVATIAREKLDDKTLAVGVLKDRATAFELSLATTTAWHGKHLSMSTLQNTDWEEVAAALDPNHPRRDKQVYVL